MPIKAELPEGWKINKRGELWISEKGRWVLPDKFLSTVLALLQEAEKVELPEQVHIEVFDFDDYKDAVFCKSKVEVDSGMKQRLCLAGVYLIQQALEMEAKDESR